MAAPTKCPYCDRTFMSAELQAAHITKVHPDKAKAAADRTPEFVKKGGDK